MARKRTLNYRELRSYDEEEGGEGRKKDEDEYEAGAEEEDEDEEAAAEDEDEEGDEEGDEDEDGAAAVKKKKKPAPKPPAKPKRSRAAKVIRLRVVWGVFNNSNQRVATYDYNKKQEAEEHAAKLAVDKKQTYFIQPIKEPMEEKEKA